MDTIFKISPATAKERIVSNKTAASRRFPSSNLLQTQLSTMEVLRSTSTAGQHSGRRTASSLAIAC
jgi:hypothetical protein